MVKLSLKGVDPYYDDILEAHIFKTCRKYYWTVSSWYEVEDLVQDALMVFTKCRAKFRGSSSPTNEERRTFMAYFQRALDNHITDLRQDVRSRRVELAFHDHSAEQEAMLEAQMTDTPDLGDVGLVSMLARAPAEILDMLKKLLVDATSTPYKDYYYIDGRAPNRILPRTRHRRSWQVRETTNHRIDRLLGPGAAAKIRGFFATGHCVPEEAPQHLEMEAVGEWTDAFGVAFWDNLEQEHGSLLA